MKKRSKLLMLAAVLVLVYMTLTSAYAAESLDDYYNEKVLPLMDQIGDNLRYRITSSTKLKDAFATAKDAVEDLEETCELVDAYKNDTELMDYLSEMKTNILNGHKRADKVSSSDSTIMSYQQDTVRYLEKFKNRIEIINATATPTRTPGDANEDGLVDIMDALAILQHNVGWEITINTSNADVDGNSTVDILDALRILQYGVGWDVTLQ